TVHKSQGMSMDAALMDLSGVFEHGQGYVALSRVRRLEGLHLLGWNERSFQVHPGVLLRDGAFRRDSESAREAFAKMPKPELAKMHKNFVKATVKPSF
ncbi:MAG TPA: helicase C-terminal domain-containing protein, partial [Candidatus Paceibacterota bacterium]